MEALLARLAPRHHRLPAYTLRPERVSVPQVSLAPLFLVHLLMVLPFLKPMTAWHMMHRKSYAMGMTQRVAPLLDWLRAETVDPRKGISTLTSVDLANSTLAQKQGIRKILTPPPSPLQPPSQKISLQQTFKLQSPAPPPAPAIQAVIPEERWGADTRSLVRICKASMEAQLPDIWRKVPPLKNYKERSAI